MEESDTGYASVGFWHDLCQGTFFTGRQRGCGEDDRADFGGI